MAEDTISVIVPAYNIAPWVGRCLDSILAQTHRDLEIIVVNDGSTDGTAEVLDDYAAAHGRVRVLHKENGGVTSARLAGVAAAGGEWIGFIDGDDTIEPTMYSRLLALARDHGADIAHCGHQIHFADGRVEFVHRTGALRLQDHRTGLRDLLDNSQVSLSLCTKLYRRSLFDGIGDWADPSIRNNEDLLLNYYLFDRARRAVFEGSCPYHYLLREGSASNRGITENYIFDPIRVRLLLLERCSGEMVEDVRQSLLRNLLFNYAQLAVHRDRRRYPHYRRQVRALLRQRREWFPLLSLRNRVLANMICIAPWTFHLAYGAYVRLFQREEQH